MDTSNFTSLPRHWTEEEDIILQNLYFTHTRREIAKILNRTEGSIRKRCSVLRLNQKQPTVTDYERDLIRQWYTDRQDKSLDEFDLDGLSNKLGRHKTFVCRLAKQMGLTHQGRPISILAKFNHSEGMKIYIASNGHPKGMLGKQHSEQFKKWQGDHVREWQSKKTTDEKGLSAQKAVRTRIEKYGTGRANWMNNENVYSRTKSGKREDLDNQFFRSAWEANYARYLNWLKSNSEIKDWEYESQTFIFHGVTRGVLTYTPDFKVINHDNSYEWHEVKGWMDAKSKAKLKRMKKFYPDETVIVIGADEYKAVSKWSAMFPDWEYPKSSKKKLN